MYYITKKNVRESFTTHHQSYSIEQRITSYVIGYHFTEFMSKNIQLITEVGVLKEKHITARIGCYTNAIPAFQYV